MCLCWKWYLSSSLTIYVKYGSEKYFCDINYTKNLNSSQLNCINCIKSYKEQCWLLISVHVPLVNEHCDPNFDNDTDHEHNAIQLRYCNNNRTIEWYASK